jgi:hypothetical protein
MLSVTSLKTGEPVGWLARRDDVSLDVADAAVARLGVSDSMWMAVPMTVEEVVQGEVGRVFLACRRGGIAPERLGLIVPACHDHEWAYVREVIRVTGFWVATDTNTTSWAMATDPVVKRWMWSLSAFPITDDIERVVLTGAARVAREVGAELVVTDVAAHHHAWLNEVGVALSCQHSDDPNSTSR